MKRVIVVILLCLLVAGVAASQDKPIPMPKLSVEVGKASSPDDVAVTLQILFLMTVLSLAPAILIMTTAFTRIVVVLHFLRQALGTQQVPPSQVLIGLAMFLTFFVMAPTWNRVNQDAIQPYMKNTISLQQAYDRGIVPVREFMLRQTREEDLALFVKLANVDKPETRDDVPIHALIPAFAISELRIGFEIGFLLFIPFLVIDMVISSILLSMGMMMLPPVLISLPFKILLFILVDGWHLVIRSLLESFR
ncbi:MAG: flagellar type III secretion system pore protein FliP [Ignavibacteriae bacterium]|mgnify:FL=1|nr:flagellar type III secretion system pore protein FliP [Ignavibacteriota bacterium]